MPPPKRGLSEPSRIILVRNLPFTTTGDDLYRTFGRFGKIRQIRLGNAKNTRGTAYVVYHDLTEAKAALDAMTGFNFEGRYLEVRPFIPVRKQAAEDIEKQRQEVAELRRIVEENSKKVRL